LDHQYINEQEIKVANITATQKQALSGMNLSDHERRMKELEAELEAVKARIAETKANIANLKADQKLIESAQPEDIPIAPDRGLTGVRGEDGTLLSEEESKKRGSFAGSSADLTTGEVTGEKGDAMAFAKAAGNIPTEEMIEEGIPVHPATVQQVEEDDMITDKQIADPEDEPEPEKDDDGRRKATEIENLRGEKPGWSMAEDSNFWSINEKDPYWKTQEGYDEAVDLYGTKPSFLKEKDVATLVYNPSTGEYEEVEQEEFEDLSRKVDPKLKKYF